MPASTSILLNTGTFISITATAPADQLLATYAALTYTKFGSVESLNGTVGGNKTITNFVDLETGNTIKLAGSIDGGKLDLSVGLITGDAGLVIAKAGFDGANKLLKHTFKITFPDGQAAYCQGLISKIEVNVKGANDVRTCGVGIEVSGAWVTNVI